MNLKELMAAVVKPPQEEQPAQKSDFPEAIAKDPKLSEELRRWAQTYTETSLSLNQDILIGQLATALKKEYHRRVKEALDEAWGKTATLELSTAVRAGLADGPLSPLDRVPRKSELNAYDRLTKIISHLDFPDIEIQAEPPTHCQNTEDADAVSRIMLWGTGPYDVLTPECICFCVL
jgi:hypothetical protein